MKTFEANQMDPVLRSFVAFEIWTSTRQLLCQTISRQNKNRAISTPEAGVDREHKGLGCNDTANSLQESRIDRKSIDLEAKAPAPEYFEAEIRS
jgi:hypothetical protein